MPRCGRPIESDPKLIFVSLYAVRCWQVLPSRPASMESFVQRHIAAADRGIQPGDQVSAAFSHIDRARTARVTDPCRRTRNRTADVVPLRPGLHISYGVLVACRLHGLPANLDGQL